MKKELGQAFIDWLISPEGQKAIADYKIGGEQLFFPNASDAERVMRNSRRALWKCARPLYRSAATPERAA